MSEMLSGGRRAPGVMNPLWIISLFLGLSEVTVGVAATQVRGWMQGSLIVFAIVFPSAIAAAFFAILWRKAYVLYAPRDFPESTPVAAFVAAMGGNVYGTSGAIEALVRSGVESAIADVAEPSISDEVRNSAANHAIEVAGESLARRAILVDITSESMRAEAGATAEITILVDEEMTVADFLNNIYFSLQGAVPPWTYGQSWWLEDGDGQSLLAMGTAWARKHDQSGDERLLSEAGIRPGQRLTARLNRPRRRGRGRAAVPQRQPA